MGAPSSGGPKGPQIDDGGRAQRTPAHPSRRASAAATARPSLASIAARRAHQRAQRTTIIGEES